MVKILQKGNVSLNVINYLKPSNVKTACVAFLALTAVNNLSAATISVKANVELTKLQQNLVTGIVTDSDNNPLQGVTVSVLSKTAKTSTDANGRFVINAQKGETLVVSLIGYLNANIVVDTKDNINVILEKDVTGLEEITVTGLAGQQKKSTLVGSITSVKPEELKIPTANLSNAIAGKLAGVVAFQRSGEPGADGSTFYIRGISTFSGINSPLIIIDGVPASTGDLNAIAPEAIESFSILKDANATAMYGTKGANGVMIVTTKRGKNLDKARINIRLENAINTPILVPKFVNGTRFMELFNEAVESRGTGEILYTRDKIEGTRNGLNSLVYPDVDWYSEMFNKNAQGRALNANVQGGGTRVDYFMSATLNMDDGMLRSSDVNSYSNNIKVNRYTFQNNLFAQLTPTTKASLKLNTQLRDYSGPNRSVTNIFANAINANPVDFPVFFPNNEQFPEGYLFGGKTGGRYNNGFINPYAWMVDGYQANFQSTLMATLDLTQSLDFLTKGLSANGLMSFKNWSSTTTSRSRGVNNYEILNYQVDADGNYIYDLGRVGSVQTETLGTGTGTSGDRSLYFQAGLNYQRTFADVHDLSGVLVYYQTDYNVNNAGGSLIASLPKRSQSYSGRLSYSYDNRYLFQGTFGYNGSENFAEGSKYGFFPSFGLGYNISNEDFFTPFKDKIHHLKLRGSWGLSGNDQIGSDRFVYLSDINLTSQSFTTGITQDYSRSGPSYNRFANPNITWEISEQYNAAIELGLFNSLNFVFDVYKEDRRNIFLSRQTIPDYLGTSGTTIYGNLGRVSAKGIDVSADYFKQITPDLSMALKGTFTYAHNTIVDYDEPDFAVNKHLNFTGHPINTQLGYIAERLFIDGAEVANSPLQQLGGFVSGGDIKYTDYNKDGLVNSDDRIRMGHPTTPEIVYGFGPSFKFKKFDFSVFFQGVARTSLFMSGFHPFGTSDQRNVLTFIADDHFSSSNPNIYAAYPKLSKLDNPNNTATSSYYMRDAAFLKLKNAELGYSYKFARFYCSGLNLLTFSKFKYWDPEQGGGAGLSYPTQRTINFGVQMTFN